jgi:hypothetical protein
VNGPRTSGTSPNGGSPKLGLQPITRPAIPPQGGFGMQQQSGPVASSNATVQDSGGSGALASAGVQLPTTTL